jgi:2'-5' RNA ligase
MSETRSHRVFFALWPDAEAVAHLSALAHELTAHGSRVMRPGSLHLTLAFVGAVPAERIPQLEEIAGAIRAEPFELSLDRLGFWPRGGVLWAGCRQAPAPLRRLAGTLAADLRGAGFAIDARAGADLVPHVTLARRARCASLPRLETPIAWRVQDFALVESHLLPSAASYRTLAGFPLAKADSD